MNKLLNKDILKLLSNEREPFAVYSTPISQCYKVTIDDDFREVRQFSELVDVLDNAQEGDIVHIKLSTVGGALHSIIPLISAMKNTQAFIHTHVESDTASAGTMIMALSHSLYVNEYATIMYHNIQYQAYGHGGNVEAQVRHTSTASKQLIRDIYESLLTDEEIKRLEDGLELYLTPEECMERFILREELRDTQECSCGSCPEEGDADIIEAIRQMSLSVTAEEEEEFKGLEAAYDAPKPVRKPRKKK